MGREYLRSYPDSPRPAEACFFGMLRQMVKEHAATRAANQAEIGRLLLHCQTLHVLLDILGALFAGKRERAAARAEN